MSDTRLIHPPDAGAAEIDWSVLDSFRALARPGKPDPVVRLLALFLETSLPLMEAIRTAASASDGTALRNAAHSLKSAGRNLGAVGLGNLCEKMERVGEAGDGPAALDLLDRIEQEYAAVAESFRDVVTRKG